MTSKQIFVRFSTGNTTNGRQRQNGKTEQGKPSSRFQCRILPVPGARRRLTCSNLLKVHDVVISLKARDAGKFIVGPGALPVICAAETFNCD